RGSMLDGQFEFHGPTTSITRAPAINAAPFGTMTSTPGATGVRCPPTSRIVPLLECRSVTRNSPEPTDTARCVFERDGSATGTGTAPAPPRAGSGSRPITTGTANDTNRFPGSTSPG